MRSERPEPKRDPLHHLCHDERQHLEWRITNQRRALRQMNKTIRERTLSAQLYAEQKDRSNAYLVKLNQSAAHRISELEEQLRKLTQENPK